MLAQSSTIGRARLMRVLVGEFSIKRLIRSTVLILMLTYVGIGCYAYFWSDKIAFQPPPATYGDTPEVLKLSSNDGSTISAFYLANPDVPCTILYSHGNAEDLGDVRPVLEGLRRAGFAVLAYDYPGYGTSTGVPGERSAYQAADAAYDFLTGQLHVPAPRVIAYGRSLGGAVAIDLAARRPVGGLVVESSFLTGLRVLTRVPIYPFDKFRSGDKIKLVHCPVFVIHGRRDGVIPFWHGEALFRAAHEPKMSLWVDGAGHNDLPEVAGTRLTDGLQRFCESVRSLR
jgi:abhydrolase domain-containing protein 17